MKETETNIVMQGNTNNSLCDLGTRGDAGVRVALVLGATKNYNPIEVDSRNITVKLRAHRHNFLDSVPGNTSNYKEIYVFHFQL